MLQKFGELRFKHFLHVEESLPSAEAKVPNWSFNEGECYVTPSLYLKENKGEERVCRKVFN